MITNRAISLLCIFLISITLSGQQPSATLYYMEGIPQRTFLNPAFQPESKVFMGSPGFSQLYLQMGNSGFSFNEITTRTDTGFVLNFNKAIAAMPQLSHLSTTFNYQPVAFGFRLLKKGYVTFDMMPRVSFQYYYPKDLFGFIWKGNAHEDYLGERISFDNMGIELSVTNEISAGYSHQIFDGFNIGLRYRAIQGVANIHTERFKGGITTDANDFTITADLDMRISMNIPFIDVDSLLDGKDVAFNQDKIADEALEYVRNNRGQAIDIGVSYKLFDRFLLSASVNDLGYINWRGNPYNFSSKGTFTYSGFDFTSYIQGDSLDKLAFDELADSIMDIFAVQRSKEGYKQVLSPSVNLGAAFFITQRNSVGFLFRSRFYQGIWFPHMTLSVNHRLGRVLSLTGTYGLERGNFSNVGLGFALKLGPFHYYLITDNALAFAYPLAAQNVMVLTGVNWLFGSRPDKGSIPSI